MILLETPKWKTAPITVNAIGGRNYSTNARSKISVKCLGSHTETCVIGLIKKNKTIVLDTKLLPNYSYVKPQFVIEIVFVDFFISEYHDYQGDEFVIFKCEASDYMIIKDSRDINLNWLDSQSLSFERKIWVAKNITTTNE